MKIAVVGCGFVGRAVINGFRNVVCAVDPVMGTKISDIKEADVIFICVPTPMGVGGAVDVSIVRSVLQETTHLNALMVLKSTVPPNYVQEFADEYEKFVYNPEFLTEANAFDDFLNPISNVYGGKPEYTALLEKIYKDYSNCTEANTYHMTAVEASFVKYLDNTFLATKVMFMNQFFDVVQKTDANYDVIKTAVINDKRIGSSHMNVPGHDGRKGYGSACYSKDVPAFINYATSVGVKISILREGWNSNCEVRNTYGKCLPREIEQHISFNKI